MGTAPLFAQIPPEGGEVKGFAIAGKGEHVFRLIDVLTPSQQHNDFSLDEPDDHTLRLLYQGKPVAVFSSSGATVAEIRAEAERIAKHRTE